MECPTSTWHKSETEETNKHPRLPTHAADFHFKKLKWIIVGKKVKANTSVRNSAPSYLANNFTCVRDMQNYVTTGADAFPLVLRGHFVQCNS